MHDIEERLVEEIRKYEHLYDSSSPDYKDSQMVADAWCEISEIVGLSVTECTKRWKNLRDKYVRLRKRHATNGDIGRKKVPAFYLCLSWLAPYVKHRDIESNCDDDNEHSLPSPPINPSHLSPKSKMVQKRKRKELDDRGIQRQVAQLEERRMELQQKLIQDNDEPSRFGQSVADMLRRIPEEHRAQAMFDVHKLLFERQQQNK
ncbi:hypothetical protein AALO_G00206000 [Alosa alosa]|uniref:MADF domain-containing protein n=1 Tax=Alosa alosa TaxID=278164 RepID=A0AAV6G6N9_9TELE|nr:uncharacterized protein LOC121684126 [Alosa sapidissima]XP_048121223.1 uncharacterized protein LOC125308698 [Alosa alosa]KAG5269777.1 hypothetical protein AALO_G00206000 [Alosa alosa]